MLTRLVIRNFKALADVSVELGQNVVLIGPNNSGKTTALQALSLWQSGLREWLARRSATKARERPGVTLNRRNLTHTPVPETRYLWRHLKVSSGAREDAADQDRRYIDIVVYGEDASGAWECGLEFYYANPESIYCRPTRKRGSAAGDTLDVPEQAKAVKVAFLPPMSGLVSEEPELQPGRLDVLIGEGQTAQVLRNLCLRVAEDRPQEWSKIVGDVERIFGVRLGLPERDPARGAVDLNYVEEGCTLDITSAGRGLQQVLLLLAHLRLNPGSVLLLDEPDAHLEILRQRSIYQLMTSAAAQSGSQVIAASHSEVILNEAGGRDVVVAFLGSRPHRINDRGTQLQKSLASIGFDHYYQAERKGWVLYLEGSTDLAMLLAWSRKLSHPAAMILAEPFVEYVGNNPRRAAEHFYGLREAKSDLRAFALFDRLPQMPHDFQLAHRCWRGREIENYVARPEVLLRFAEGEEPDDLVGRANRDRRIEAMRDAIGKIENAFRDLGRDVWSADEKASDDVLPPIFRAYFGALGVSDRMNKSEFYSLAECMTAEMIDPEVVSVLDSLHASLVGAP